MPDGQRIDRLRSQLGASTEIPDSIADLFVGSRLLPWKISEALGRWQRLRADAGAGTDGEAELDRLTRALAEHFGDED